MYTNSARNCGPFRYWTVSNIPLFLLATPMFIILAISSKWGLSAGVPVPTPNDTHKPSIKIEATSHTQIQRNQVLRNLALSQLLLTALTLTTAHVQIITRISSACPVWVWYLATSRNENSFLTNGFVTFIVVYSLIQGGLFASFLPPA